MKLRQRFRVQRAYSRLWLFGIVTSVALPYFVLFWLVALYEPGAEPPTIDQIGKTVSFEEYVEWSNLNPLDDVLLYIKLVLVSMVGTTVSLAAAPFKKGRKLVVFVGILLLHPLIYLECLILLRAVGEIFTARGWFLES